ncbi:integrase arm-type DNA-binding domain-containing protein [Paraliomyxa miuraensis]|uniref:integrase arm-type DNA-binding domain-containing protein n=1 Tax=Paraliomyxa miuraensis TaxID=376150 RepID=UPI00224DF87A|nr:integrase arm-type DNA-binding domain-containing protein [Paraliomyxa miuraensis]MCX4239945.1 integrase arm-type DNA-binding domain-containing protein [Paraliomyxa miuraensis]
MPGFGRNRCPGAAGIGAQVRAEFANKTTIDRLQPGPARYDVIDDQIKGFIIRVNTDGTKTAMLRYRRDGRNRAYKLGVIMGDYTAHQARVDAAKARAIVEAGGDPARERDARKAAPTLAEVAERYMTELARPYRKPSTVRGYESLLRVHLLPALGRMKIGEIERADVQRLHQRIGETAPGAANRALALVSVIMTNAERWGYRDTRSNPCHRMPKFPERKMERFLSAEERARLDAVLAEGERMRP